MEGCGGEVERLLMEGGGGDGGLGVEGGEMNRAWFARTDKGG